MGGFRTLDRWLARQPFSSVTTGRFLSLNTHTRSLGGDFIQKWLILSNFPDFTWIMCEENIGDHSGKFLCAPNVQNMASDPDIKSGGGKSGVCETAISQNSHDLLMSTCLQIFSFYQVLRMLCEHCGKRGHCETPKCLKLVKTVKD